MIGHLEKRFSSLLVGSFLLGCGGGIDSYGPADTRKLTDIIHAQVSELALCSAEDGGSCVPSHVRALSEVTRCKVASILYAHQQPVPNDAGGDCTP